MPESQTQSELECRPEPIEPGGYYKTQEGDTLFSIAQRAYGDDKLAQEIAIANVLVLEKDIRLTPRPGTRLYIEANPRRVQMFLATQCCTVTVPNGLLGRSRPDTNAGIVTGFWEGFGLCFDWVTEGEDVDGVFCWGYSSQYGCYFWMGGTDWDGSC